MATTAVANRPAGNAALATTNPDAETIRVLGESLYPGAKPQSIAMVLAYCKAAKLDPFQKPVHIVPMSVKKAGTNNYEMRDVIMPGVSSYRTAAARSGAYLGKSEPEFGPDVTEKVGAVMITYPAWCRITVKRRIGEHVAEFTAHERWMENYATAGRDKPEPNTMWRKRPYGQLAKCCEAQALRMAFPELVGGEATAEEMEGKVIEAVVAAELPAAQAKPALEERKSAKLDAFSGSKPQPAKAQAQAAPDDYVPPGDIVDVEATDVPDGVVPDMPEDAAADWAKGKFMKPWKWLNDTLDEEQDRDVKQAIVDRYRDVLAKVQAYNDRYAAAVAELESKHEVEINVGGE